ncbi:MAG: LysM domain-containing protein [Cyanobacteriota bacterium]|nr:LysM domain-containing protein [Cyanobacteriota bacterium]
MSPSNSSNIYIVLKGDTLWTICSALYNIPARCTEVAKLNGITDPTKLRTGTALKVPTDGLRSQPQRYTIRKDDIYCELAATCLRDYSRWPEFVKLNAIAPTALRTGMQIFVPIDFRHPG